MLFRSILTPDKKKIKSWNLSGLKIKKLPELFGALEILDSLDLSFNSIMKLPDYFGFIKVGNKIKLANNELNELPKSFENITINILFLDGNNLTILPEWFYNIRINLMLNLDYNKNLEISESFYGIKKFGRISIFLPNHLKDNEIIKFIKDDPTFPIIKF